MIFQIPGRHFHGGIFVFITKNKGNEIMKKTYLLIIAGVIGMPLSQAVAVTTGCMTYEECVATITNSRTQQCCWTGRTQTIYTCPDIFVADSNGTCSRRSATIADGIGTLTVTYGTCTGTSAGIRECHDRVAANSVACK